MKKFIVKKDFFEIFPNAHIAVIIAKNIDNTKNIEGQNLLNQGIDISEQYIDNFIWTDNKVIKYWREAFRKFKSKKGARCSIEALLKRVHNGNKINSINPLVDIYNYISLKYGVPCGGEDINKIKGNMLLTKAMGDENFITYGSDISEPPYSEEIVYKDDLGAICRCLNWRECTRTLLDEQTKEAILFIESIDETNLENIKNASLEMENLIKDKLKGKTILKILNKENFEIEF
ncbi:B3/4 domain-containing protein [Mycoplasmopsis lipophila]|uniref:B3/B4 domain-containing protein n=1 Tax=Mycoplasmopsis lipophila TaxID=2117 RepID=UPI003873CC54